MKFTYDEADKSQTISCYEVDGIKYIIKYLDGTKDEFISYNPDEERKLQEKMIEQAIDRDAHISLEDLKQNKKACKLLTILAIITSAIFLKRGEDTLKWITIIEGLISGLGFIEERKKINELVKYRIFLEIMNDIKKVHESELLKCIEFDNFYQIPLNINTLDGYSLNDMKKIRARLYNKLIDKK